MRVPTWSVFIVMALLSMQTEPAFQRHGREIADVASRFRTPQSPARPGSLAALPDAELERRLGPILADLEADLRAGKLAPAQAYATFEALGAMRGFARPSVPTIVSVLGAWDRDSFFRVPYFCTGVKALAQIAPTSPEVITALSDALGRALPSRGSVCHRCGCLLEALEQSGPAARTIAGPVLARVMDEPRFLTTYDWQLGRAIKAIGIGANLPIALRRVGSEDMLPGDRAGILRALANDSATFDASERGAFRTAVAPLLANEIVEIRTAAADTLHAAGAPAVPDLIRALDDWHFEVRAAAARSLGKLGPPADRAGDALAAALDPYLGTAETAAEALVAVGPAALPAIEARRPRVPAPLSALAAATARAVREQRISPVRDELARGFQKGPFDKGYVKMDVLRAGAGATPYDPVKHRVTLHYVVQPYGGPGRSPDRTTDAIVSLSAPNNALMALRGRRAGDVVRLLMSPDIAVSPAYGTSRHNDAWQTHVMGTPGSFEIAIDRVCEPVIWTAFRGYGIFGPIQFETYCRD
jgi:hypothetical protein